ncbi:MAG: hypothetical protein ACI8Y4_004983, partial [Candidatus Poriferisodalaceae bacterium]
CCARIFTLLHRQPPTDLLGTCLNFVQRVPIHEE